MRALRTMPPSRVTSALTRSIAEINSKKMQYELQKGGVLPPLETLTFGTSFGTHMLEVDHDVDSGWAAPTIHPKRALELDPASLVFHYGLECFEGMKAYKDAHGNRRLFRPDLNMQRFERSSTRLGMAGFDHDEMLECIKELVRVDEAFIPDRKGYSLYLRPTMIGTSAELGVRMSRKSKCFVLSSPVGPYYPTGFRPVSLLASNPLVRAWPGGMGAFKVGGNYAPGIMPTVNAVKGGYQQVMWLLNGQLSEVGVMNLFVYWTNEDGEEELLTPPLDGTILPGVTRRSVLELAQEWNEFKVTEGYLHIDQLTRAVDEGRVREVFGVGTACVVAPVEGISYEGKDYPIPLGKGKDRVVGELAERLSDTLLAIQYGEIDHEWSVVF